jgi:hypothetical protein
MAEDNDKVGEFWNKVREKRGGEATVRAFGRYLGRSGDGLITERSGLVYLAAGKLWFETVETQAKIFGIPLPDDEKRRSEPIDFGIGLDEIESAGVVGLKDALACVNGKYDSANLKPLGFWGGFFDTGVLQVKLRDGTSVFVEASKDRELAESLSKKK